MWLEEESEFSQVFPGPLHFPGVALWVVCWLCLVNLTQLPMQRVTEARTKAGEGHPAETQVSQETLRPENSMNIS